MQATRNPWSLEHVPGGSSGGSAAAVAAGQCIAALGSDTGAAISLAFGGALPGLLGEQGLRGLHVRGANRLQEAVTNLIALALVLGDASCHAEQEAGGHCVAPSVRMGGESPMRRGGDSSCRTHLN